MTSQIGWKHLPVWVTETINIFTKTNFNDGIVCNDESFGPVSNCRFFDFTLNFQNSILLISSGTFILASLIQLLILLNQPLNGTNSQKWLPIFQRNRIDYTALIRISLASLQIIISAALLGLSVDENEINSALISKTAIPAYSLTFFASIIQLPLTIFSRQRLSSGTAILPIYLFATIFTDASRLRSYSDIFVLQDSHFFRLCIVSLLIKCLTFFIENTSGIPDPDATPDSRAGFISKMTFWWLVKLLWTGFRRPLDMVNLSTLGSGFDSEMLGKKLQSKWNKQISKAVNRANRVHRGKNQKQRIDQEEIELNDLNEEGSSLDGFNRAQVEQTATESSTLLLRSCFFAFPLPIMAPAIPALIHVGIQLSLPYLVSRTLAFAESQLDVENRQPSSYGWGLVGAYAFTSLLDAFASGQFYWLADKVQIRLRGALIDIIYRKSLRIHLSIANELGGGSIANLMSVDLERFSKIVIPFHFLWTGLIQVGISTYLLYRQIGWSFLASVVSIIICLAIPPLLAKEVGPRQKLWSASTDKRVNLLSSAVNNAKGVKYMAYERFIAEKLLEAREEELKHGWSYMLRIIIIATVTNLVKEITALFTFTTLFLVDHITGSHRFNINNVITALTLLSLLEVPILLIGQQYGSIVSALVSLKRIQVFLGKRERPLVTATMGPIQGAGDSSRKNSSEFRPESIATTPSVGNVKVDFDLKSIASLDDSSIAASFHSASLGWTPNGKAVLINVSLQIPVNKLTMICGPIGCGKTTLLQAILGEVDVLSGQIRLPILRESVAYVAQDGWLQENATIRDNITLQMPFEAELYQTVIYAAGLHIDLQQLDKHDDTLAKSLSGGQRQRLALARALYTQADTYLMDDFTSALDSETAAHVWNALMGPTGLLRNKTVIFASNSLNFLKKASMVIRLQSGKVVEVGRPQDMSDDARDAISRASIDEQERANLEAKKEAFKFMENSDRKDSKHEEVEHGEIKWSVYKQWILAAGVFLSFFVLVVGFGVVTGLKNSWIIYLQYFARAQDTIKGMKNQWSWLTGFIVLILSAMALFPVVDIMSIDICFTRVGRKMHAAEVKGVWNAGIKFFESNPPGVIINRFSQDIFILDWELTIALTNFVFAIFDLLCQLLLLIIPVPVLLVVVAIIGVAYIAIQKLYAPVSRQLRRLEMATKSPLYSQISETSQASGLATIRALRRQKIFIDINTGRLDRSQQPYFYLQAVRRWLLTSLNLLSLVVNVALVTLVVLLKNTKNVAVLGAGLVNACSLSLMLNIALISYTEVEITSIAIERIIGFASLEPEEQPIVNGKKLETLKPSEVEGKIELRNLSITYPEAPKPALRNLNLIVKPGERIGICGRSGSGKSTLLLAIFRMLEPTEGEIFLDDEKVQNYSAFSLRNSLTIVPQNALVLSASVRENLDPLGEQDDATIWTALETCHLMEVVRQFPNGLSTKLDANFNLSAGQRQLFNLTRALLRKRRILVLDEATSSMDYETDAKVQELLRSQFSHCTILTVAHRIATVRDYDRILVLGNGELIELDSPDNLMQNPKSAFRSLAVEQNVQ